MIQFDRYRLQEGLYTSQNITVYRARAASGKDCVLLFFHFPHLHDTRLHRRFEKLVQRFHSLPRHPSLVPILDGGIAQGLPYCVFSGRALSPSILQTGHFPFSLQQAIQILLPLARALEHLHSYHLTHDDISLRTILCSNTNLPLLSAPGIRALLAVEGDTRKMQPYNNVRSGWGTFLGDPATIAPECIYGHPPTPESDIYSLGKVFLFFLTKAPVSSGQSFLHLANQHIHHPRPYPGLPEEAQELLSGMLASNPHQRISLKRIIDHCTSILSMKHQEELQR